MAKTSDRVSSIARKHWHITPNKLLSLTATEEGRRELASDIQAMCGSLLRQDEVRGVRKLLKLVTG